MTRIQNNDWIQSMVKKRFFSIGIPGNVQLFTVILKLFSSTCRNSYLLEALKTLLSHSTSSKKCHCFYEAEAHVQVIPNIFGISPLLREHAFTTFSEGCFRLLYMIMYEMMHTWGVSC